MTDEGASTAPRALEWFTRSASLEAARAALPQKAFGEALAKAASHLEVVELALEPPEEFASGDPNDAILLLLAEALRVVLVAKAHLAPSSTLDSALAALAETGASSLERFAPEGATVDDVLRWLNSGRASALDGLSVPEIDDRVAVCRAFVRAAVADAREPWTRVRRLEGQRRMRFVTVMCAAMVVLAGGTMAFRRLTAKADLATGKPFTASSAYEPFSASGKANTPIEFDTFFHTREEDHPWVKIDLGAVTRVKSIDVKNRPDCCGERAVPLVIESSMDGDTWLELARRSDSFSEWTATINPTDMRFVRLSVPRRTFLHLSRVLVWR